MSESGDYDPGPWSGYDFASARASYDNHVGRSYDVAVKKSVKAADLIPSRVSTQSESPVVIVCDVTGSMGDWPTTIFSKLPYLDKEGSEYLPGQEISFAAVGDANSDKYPLQVQPFCSGLSLKDALEKLVIEGNGGGQSNESYELPALYYARNCDMPNAIRPIMIIIGDEGVYDFVKKEQAETYCEATLQETMTAADVFNELKQKFAVYLIRKPYSAALEKSIQRQWEELLGADHVCSLPSADRVVDVIFGIFAKETGRIDYFKEEIKGRQRPEQVATVMKSLVSIHLPKNSVKKLPGRSVTRRKNFDPDDPDNAGNVPDSISLL